MSDGWIGVDLDGTLAAYNGWQGAEHIGEPIGPMLDRVRRWLAEGREVKIFTARVSEPNGSKRLGVIVAIEQWSEEHIGQILPITCMKDYTMDELWDDRVVQVEFNTGRQIGYSRRGLDGE